MAAVVVVSLLAVFYWRSLRKSEAKLRREEGRFRAVIENSTDAIFMFGANGEILDANRRACRSLGYSRAELVGLHASDIEVGFGDFPGERRRLMAGESAIVEGFRRRKDGTTFPVEVLEVDDGKFIMSIARDVGERREMLADMKEAEARNRAVLDAIPDLVFRFALDGEVLDTKPGRYGRLHVPTRGIVGSNLKDLLPNDVSGDVLCGAAVAVETGCPQSVECVLPAVDGEMVFDVRVVAGGEGEAVCFARDMTERREYEARSEAVLRSIPDAVCRISRDGKYLDVWAGEDRRLLRSREDVLEGSVRSILGDEVADEFMPLVERAIETREIQTLEYTLTSNEGEEFDLEARIVRSGEDEAIYFARDMSERNNAMRRLRDSETRNRVMLEAIPDLVFRLSREGEYLHFHASDEGKLIAPPGGIIGRKVGEILPVGVAEILVEGIAATLDTGEMQIVEYELSVPDGDLHFEARIVASGEDEVIYFARDITEQTKATRSLVRSEERNRAILEAIPDAVFRWSRDGEYLDMHIHEEFRLVYPTRRLIGERLTDILPEDIAAKFMGAISDVLDAGGLREFEYELSGPNGVSYREARMVASGPDEVTCFVRDIGERHDFETRIKRLAYHDELTNLPNRSAFMEMVEAEVGGRYAIIILSLRGFTKVNDSLGREAGDRLLAMSARHIGWYFREIGAVARFDGDEFAILAKDYSNLREILEFIEEGQRIYSNMPFMLDEVEVFLRAAVGIVEADPDDDVESVVRKASVALLEAKRNAEADYMVFDPSMGERAYARLRLERDLRLALEYGQLEVHYQPEIFLGSGRIYSLEALARWNHPEHGYISPAVFIPLAEESGLIMRLGEYVLDEACRRMRMWRESLPEAAPCSVSVNISAVQLRARDLASKISRILADSGIEPECLQLEITESAAMGDLESCRDIFDELRELGVRVALDDFGTGYSSLSCLRQFPLDSLKVDRSFISTLEDDPQMANVVGSIIELAHALELEVISEGIETPGQLSTLRRLGCDIGQGYHFSHPLPPHEALDLLASWQTLDLLDGAG